MVALASVLLSCPLRRLIIAESEPEADRVKSEPEADRVKSEPEQTE